MTYVFNGIQRRVNDAFNIGCTRYPSPTSDPSVLIDFMKLMRTGSIIDRVYRRYAHHTFPAEMESANRWLSCPAPRDDFSIDECLHLVWIMTVVFNRCRLMRRGYGEGLGWVPSTQVRGLLEIALSARVRHQHGQSEADYRVTRVTMVMN